MSENRKTHVIMLRTAAVLLILVMLSTGMAAGRFARYVTTAAFEDGARVARFNIVDHTSTLFTDVRVDVQPNSTVAEKVILKNYSEVAVKFTVKVENIYHNIPLAFQVTDGENILAKTEIEDGPVTFTGTIGPNQTETEYKLLITWPKGEDDLKHCGRVDVIRVLVNAAQAD